VRPSRRLPWREAREETGLDTAIERFVTTVDRIHRDASGTVQYHFVLADYRCRVVGGSLQAGDDADDAVWVEVGDLGRYEVAQATIDVIDMAMRG
jgi:ADP-ribose pyrophosphatase YjhB (NUDIX family)